jgi:hypothetical protein
LNEYLRQIELAVRHTKFYSRTSYSLFGRANNNKIVLTKIKALLSNSELRGYILQSLKTQLYTDFYCTGSPLPISSYYQRQRILHHNDLPDPIHVEALSKANSGSGYDEEGWEVYTLNNSENDGCSGYNDSKSKNDDARKSGLVVVSKDSGMQLFVQPHELSTLEKHHSDYSVGTKVALRLPKEMRGISPGFYMALSNTPFPKNRKRREQIVIFYWNLSPQGAVIFMRLATVILNKSKLPFRLKALDNLGAFNNRCDTAVLYISKSYYRPIFKLIQKIYPSIKPFLREQIPLFTKRVAIGVGVAEEPDNGESFGQYRCRLLAEGIIRAYEKGDRFIGERLQSVIRRFDEDKINLNKPFLNSSSNCYDLL